MTLPTSIPRCPGMPKPAGDWPFPRDVPDCLMDCARRRQGIADYMNGVKVEWMVAPESGPCEEMLRMKR